MDKILAPWPWYVSGPLISLCMFLLLYLGKRFGVSSNLKTICAISGAGKTASFFRFDWKKDIWNLLVVFGATIGGFIAVNFLSDGQNPDLNPKTISQLKELGFQSAGDVYLPSELYNFEDPKAILLLLIAGILIGFGSRYADGCTSGHSISGLSNLQIPSLLATIGFFIGGLIMVHFIFPFIF